MKLFFLFILFVTALLLPGCLYDQPPSQPARQLDTWLLGTWITQDKSGKVFEVSLAPKDNLRYRVTFWNKDKIGQPPWEFEGWISRVENLDFLTLQAVSKDPRYHGKYLFLHYELLRREKAPYHGLGALRIRITEPELPESARTLDSYHLRQEITDQFNKRTLFSSDAAVWTKE